LFKPHEVKTMNMRFALCGIALAAFVTPALAASAFYVAQDTGTMKCSIVAAKPTAATSKLVGTTGYATEAGAESGMLAAKDCAIK
jgi:hypothetical protein